MGSPVSGSSVVWGELVCPIRRQREAPESGRNRLCEVERDQDGCEAGGTLSQTGTE